MLLPQTFWDAGTSMYPPMHSRKENVCSGGKLEPSPIQAVDDGATFRHLLITDRASGLRFLVDMEADISLIPRVKTSKTIQSTTFHLFAANGSRINTYGTKLLNIDLGLRRAFKWKFCVVDVQKPILGADFLNYYALLVDIRNHRLVDSVTQLKANGTTSLVTIDSISTIIPNSKYHELLTRFPNLVKPPPGSTSRTHGVEHHIVTQGQPSASPPRRLSPKKLRAAKAEFAYMMEQGICRPSSSPYSSPLHMVPKKEAGTWRPCGDYKRSMPRQSRTVIHYRTFRTSPQGFTIRGYFQKLILLEHFFRFLWLRPIPKTAVITPFGLTNSLPCHLDFAMRPRPSNA